MKKTILLLLGLLIVTVGCLPAPTQVSPTVTPAPSLPTPVPPTATAIPTPTLIPMPANEAIVPVNLKEPIIVVNRQIKFTIMEAKNLGNAVGAYGGTISIKLEDRDTHYLLALKILAENQTDKDILFLDLGAQVCRNAKEAVCVIVQDDNGRELKMAGFANGETSTPAGVYWWDASKSFVLFKAGNRQFHYFAFVAPNKLTRFTFYLHPGINP